MDRTVQGSDPMDSQTLRLYQETLVKLNKELQENIRVLPDEMKRKVQGFLAEHTHDFVSNMILVVENLKTEAEFASNPAALREYRKEYWGSLEKLKY